MADAPFIEPTTASGLALPVPVIVVISIGAYIVLVLIILFVRQCLLSRGICGDSCLCLGKEGEPQCCECWIACCEACNCCRNPSINACLDSICPARRQLDCGDIVMCQCCANDCCGGNEPLCDCGNCNCNCQCQPPECESINCFCFELKLKDQPMDNEDY